VFQINKKLMKAILICYCMILLSCSNHKQVVDNNDLTSNCSEIIIFLENHNWQKHTNNMFSGAVYYSIDRCSLKSFANFLNKHKCELRSVDEMRQLFGDETYSSKPKETGILIAVELGFG